MAKAKDEIKIKATSLNKQEVAAYIGISVTKFNKEEDELYACGFPRPNPITKRWYTPAVDEWLQAMSGMKRNQSSNTNPWESAIGG